MSATPNNLKAVAMGQQTPSEAKNPYLQFKDQLERAKPQLLGLMGGSKDNVEKLIGVIEQAVLGNMDLLNADRRSLLQACMKAANDGLMPDGREAVLNIYNTKVKRGGREEWIQMVQYLPMVAGYVKGLYAHPDVTYVDAAAVYENDRFMFRRGDDAKLEHEPTLDDDAGKVIAAYLVVKLKSGEIKREVMPRRDIEKVRGASKSGSGDNSPWTKWYDQQAIKSVIKRGAKQLPRVSRFDQIDRHDNEELGFTGTPDNVATAIMGALAPSAPALGHNPSEIIEHGPLDQRHEEMAGQEHGEHPAQAAGQQQEIGDEGHQREEPPAPTYAALAGRLKKAKSRDGADEILDEGRSLPPEQQTELRKLADDKFPPQE